VKENIVTRIYRHTIADAPEASRPVLEGYVSFSPTGKLLNLHAQMAHSPMVLTAYFLNYAQTPVDLPDVGASGVAGAAGAAAPGAAAGAAASSGGRG
jgi:hypothetical protein